MIYKSYLVEQDLNRIDKNFILFYGENLGLKNDFKKKIKLNNKNAETVILLQEDIIKDEDNFINMVFNLSLFQKEKVFIIDNVNEKIFPIIENIEQKVVEQKIILFSELLDKKSKLRTYFEKSKTFGIIPCYADNEISLKKIILNELKGYRGLSSQNLNMIIENSGNDRSKLNNELEKIATFFENYEKSVLENSKIIRSINNANLLNIFKYLHGNLYFKIKYFYHQNKLINNEENKKKFFILEKYFTM